MKFVLGSAFAVSMVNAYSSLLDDCQAFAGIFSGTCGGVVSNQTTNFQYLGSTWATD